MKSLLAFFKKEWLESIRTGKLIIIIILFSLFGIMNPAAAKLTPWLLDLMSDTYAELGVTLPEVTVNALTSWAQFFKNISTALIIFIIIYSGILTKEYVSGTLILILTKGLSRYKVILAKSTLLLLLWTVCYWGCFFITYGFNSYFWDNSIAEGIFFAAVCWWLFGTLTVCLIVFFSSIFGNTTGVLLGTGGCVMGMYLIGFLPKIKYYVPTFLMNSTEILSKTQTTESFTKAILITTIMCFACITASIPIMNKKQL